VTPLGEYFKNLEYLLEHGAAHVNIANSMRHMANYLKK